MNHSENQSARDFCDSLPDDPRLGPTDVEPADPPLNRTHPFATIAAYLTRESDASVHATLAHVPLRRDRPTQSEEISFQESLGVNSGLFSDTCHFTLTSPNLDPYFEVEPPPPLFLSLPQGTDESCENVGSGAQSKECSGQLQNEETKSIPLSPRTERVFRTIQEKLEKKYKEVTTSDGLMSARTEAEIAEKGNAAVLEALQDALPDGEQSKKRICWRFTAIINRRHRINLGCLTRKNEARMTSYTLPKTIRNRPPGTEEGARATQDKGGVKSNVSSFSDRKEQMPERFDTMVVIATPHYC
mmetsp:Transcript_2468/g.3292  ORF Transcript_2468/g.3292 Transcript_2468/m.3292 type:complete len:301 (+) Transcript_2468:80-982(+)